MLGFFNVELMKKLKKSYFFIIQRYCEVLLSRAFFSVQIESDKKGVFGGGGEVSSIREEKIASNLWFAPIVR